MKFIKLADSKGTTVINTDHLVCLNKISTYEGTYVDVYLVDGSRFKTTMTIEQIEELINKKD